jgi:ribosomal protein L37AE/L43A
VSRRDPNCRIIFTSSGYPENPSREDFSMTKMAAARRSSFGMRCAHCNDHLIAPEWTEQRNNRQIHHVWHCSRCDFYFETIVYTKVIDDSTGDDTLPSRLVA